MAQYEIIIKKGWNWINYSNNEEISIDETDFGFTPADGDVIKSQTKFAKYYEGYGWDGSLEILQTGDAYMYFIILKPLFLQQYQDTHHILLNCE